MKEQKDRYPKDSVTKAAAWLHERGANVLPLDGKEVIPSWKRWQTERQSQSQVNALPWGQATGLGVMAGIEDWRCLDVDGCASLGTIMKITRAMGLPDNYRWTPKSGSRNGFHIWLRCSEDDAFGGCDEWLPTGGQDFDHIEVRWRNVQTAMPPSVHPDTGKKYIFPTVPPKNPPREVTAEAVREGLRAVAKPKRSRPVGKTARRSSGGDHDDPEVEEIESALSALPDSFGEDYWDWLDIIMAVKDGAPDKDTAEALLKDWRSEWDAGEYRRTLDSLDGGPPDGVRPKTVATLFWLAQQHGWSFSDRSNDMPEYSLSDFEEEIEALDIELPAEDSQSKARLEYEAGNLTEKAARMEEGDIEQAAAFLRMNGARARAARDWKGAVKKTRRSQLESTEEQDGTSASPQELEHGELTAWIAEEVQEEDHFALDRSGALYYYRGGRYMDGGEDYLNKQVKGVLDEAGMTKEFTRYRCEEVKHRIVTEAPELWDDPPRDRLNLKNGILNLQTGEIEEHGPKKWLSTRQIPIAHDPNADGTEWRKALEKWMPDDGGAELGFEVIAYNLMPAFGRRKATFLYGGKNEGKSSFLRNLVEGVFGLGGVKHMTLQEIDGDPFAAADLFGTALNVCADLPAERMEATSVFKRITGGDRMSAQRKYKDRFNFTPHCNLVFSGNAPIIAPNSGEPFWDRWLVIPFRGNDFGEGESLSEEELDRRLQDPEELSALLNELLRVLPKVRREGVTERKSMADALHDIRMHPSNPSPPHAGDSTATGNGSAPEPKSLSDPKTGKEQAVDRGTPYSQNFEKERGSDTHTTDGVCVQGGSLFKSFERGDEVSTPDGPGTVKALREESGTVVVSTEHGPAKRYKPEALDDQGEAPF